MRPLGIGSPLNLTVPLTSPTAGPPQPATRNDVAAAMAQATAARGIERDMRGCSWRDTRSFTAPQGAAKLARRATRYQSGPRGSLPLGVVAYHQVVAEMPAVTKRTEASPKSTLMPPGWGDCGRL